MAGRFFNFGYDVGWFLGRFTKGHREKTFLRGAGKTTVKAKEASWWAEGKAAGAREALFTSEGREKIGFWLGENSRKVQIAAGVGLGAYGYMSGSPEASTWQNIERAAGFATVGALASSPKFRGKLTKQAKVGMKAAGIWNSSTQAVQAMATRGIAGWAGVGRGAAAGALYGAIDDDTTILGGAIGGAGLVGLGKLASGGIRASNKRVLATKTVHEEGLAMAGRMNALGAISDANLINRTNRKAPGLIDKLRIGGRTGALAGGTVGLYAGGPVGMVGGAIIGGIGGGTLRLSSKYKRTAKAIGTVGIAGLATAAIIGGAASNAYSMHQGGRNNLGADGDLALGLHALRHG